MSWAQTWTIIAAVAGLLGLQTYWISRSLNELRRSLDDLRNDIRHSLDGLREEMHRGFDQLDRRLERIEHEIAGHTDRITRLEERRVS